MKYIFVIVAILFSLSLSFPSKAGLVNHNYYTASGEYASAILHEETGLEWLTPDGTKGMSFAEVMSVLDSEFLHFRLPTEDELRYLFDSNLYTINMNKSTDRHAFKSYNRQTPGYKEGSRVVDRLIDGNITSSSSYYERSFGIYQTDSGELKRIGHQRDGSFYFKVFGFGYSGTVTEDYKASHTGVFLVSDGGGTEQSKMDPTLNINNPNAPINTVSTPSIFGLIGMLLFMVFRRKAASAAF